MTVMMKSEQELGHLSLLLSALRQDLLLNCNSLIESTGLFLSLPPHAEIIDAYSHIQRFSCVLES